MFRCDKCGLCCQSLAGVELYADLDRGDGTCKFFDEGSCLCMIYQDRPLLCRVDESYERYFADVMTREAYEQLNYKACTELKKRFAKDR